MCGFVGLVGSADLPERRRTAIERAAVTISHRGPDSTGVVATTRAHVAFRRLAVVDVHGGDQPLSNEDGTVEVFLNGEIFNHAELRHQLIARGHRFRTRADTEVLPHLWEEEGAAMLTRLNGMFAICVIDHRSGEIFLARDRIGVKPLFYAETSTGVVFGSELKAILASELVEPRVRREVATRFVDTLSAGGRPTLIRGVDRLLPGESLQLHADGRKVVTRWYDLADQIAPDRGPSAGEEVMSRLRDAVALQLRADVPVGLSLSGGIDSSLLALLARETGHRDLHAFTVDFDDAPRDEVESARAVASHLKLQHEVVHSSTADFIEGAPAIIWASDEPVADPAFYPALRVAEAASRSVTVLLAGSGADELFGGYGHHWLSLRRRVASLVPHPMRGGIAPHLRRAGLDSDAVAALLRYRVDRFPWHARAMSHLTDDERTLLTSSIPGSAAPLGLLQEAFARTSGSTLQQQLYADTVTYLPNQLLPLLDRTTMTYSVEGRVPFLDHNVVETALRLPDRDKIGTGGETKLLLRRALRHNVPDIVLDRPKLGFPNAVQSWLRGELGDLVPGVLGDPGGLVLETFPPAWIRQLTADRASMLARWPVIYGLLVLQVWHRLFVIERVTAQPDVSLRELYRVSSRQTDR